MNGSASESGQKWSQIVPMFVVAFVIMACIRSLGDAGGGKAFGFVPRGWWKGVDSNAEFYASWLRGTVGLEPGFARLKGLGLKPFSVGLVAALSVGAVSIALIKLLAPIMC